ncbi:MAG: hypothetical protein AB1847_06405 [bacterium]
MLKSATLASIPVGLIWAGIVYVRAGHIVPAMQGNAPFHTMSFGQVRAFLTVLFGLAAFGPGLLAAFLYSFVSSRLHWGMGSFLMLLLALAAIGSLAAAALKTPFVAEKTVIHFVAALGFGLLIPLLI